MTIFRSASAWQACDEQEGRGAAEVCRALKGADRSLNVTIDVPSVADTEKVNRVLVNVHGVNDAVLAHSKPAAI
jgi:hypothetical protein